MTFYYILLGIIIIGIICKFDNYKTSYIYIYISFVYIIAIQGLRKIIVGVDVSGYIGGFKLAKELNFLSGDRLFNYELGYSIYSQFFSKLNLPEQIYLFIVSLTIMLPIFYTILKISKIPSLSVLIYITFGFFTFSFSGLRQAIAIGITFFSFKFIKEQKKVWFILFCFLAMSFHKSAFIFLLSYPIYYLKISKKFFLFFNFIFLVLFIFKDKLFLIFYKFYKGRTGEIEITNAYNMLILLIILLIVSYLFVRNNYEIINGYRNFLIITITLQIFASVSNIAMRLGYYYYIFLILLIPEIIYKQSIKNNRIIMTITVILFAVYFFQKNTGNGYLNVSPYYFYWQ